MSDHSPSSLGEQARRLSPPQNVPHEEGRVVLDTNVVLDWLVFDDAAVQPVRAAIEAGRLNWCVVPAMRVELAHMLGHRELARWGHDPATALARFDALAQLTSSPPIASTPPGLRCRDADDQIFIDLALARSARWLLTRDRALLTLARNARAHQLLIMTPAHWATGAGAQA